MFNNNTLNFTTLKTICISLQNAGVSNSLNNRSKLGRTGIHSLHMYVCKPAQSCIVKSCEDRAMNCGLPSGVYVGVCSLGHGYEVFYVLLVGSMSDILRFLVRDHHWFIHGVWMPDLFIFLGWVR